LLPGLLDLRPCRVIWPLLRLRRHDQDANENGSARTFHLIRRAEIKPVTLKVPPLNVACVTR
jgi:hypothetical protein